MKESFSFCKQNMISDRRNSSRRGCVSQLTNLAVSTNLEFDRTLVHQSGNKILRFFGGSLLFFSSALAFIGMQSAVQKRFSSQGQVWPAIPSCSQKIREALTKKEIQKKKCNVEKTLGKGRGLWCISVQQMCSHWKIIALCRKAENEKNEMVQNWIQNERRNSK